MYKRVIEVQKKSFQLELECIRGKIQKLKLEVKTLRILAQQLAHKTFPAKAVTSSKSDNQEKKEKKEKKTDKANRRSKQKPKTLANYIHITKTSVLTKTR